MLRDILEKPIPIKSSLSAECKSFLKCILDKKKTFFGFQEGFEGIRLF